jgi:hypothetical protein
MLKAEVFWIRALLCITIYVAETDITHNTQEGPNLGLITVFQISFPGYFIENLAF